MGLSERVDQFLDQTYAGKSSTIFRDLSLNFKKVMTESPLEEVDRLLALLAIGKSLDCVPMQELAQAGLREQGIEDSIILEAQENAAIMGMLNTYYKFKGYLSPESLDNYSRAGLRMQSFMKPAMGKERFEMLALAVSVVNGCPSCISSHEKALVQLGVVPDKIHDLARLAAVSKGLATLT